MLNSQQIEEVWEGQIAAEVRSLYFGDLEAVITRRKQWITCSSFFLSVGAVATLVGKYPVAIPIGLSAAIAAMTAYSLAANLDSKIKAIAKLHYAWNQLAKDYKRLWNETWSEDAVLELDDLQQRELEFSLLATTDAPNDPKRMLRWENQVFKLHELESA